jgi:hypothetical protein
MIRSHMVMPGGEVRTVLIAEASPWDMPHWG